jgi:prophage antirepressor-like protein
MNNQIIPFKFESHDVRTLVIDGAEWWAGKDVAEALGFKDPLSAIRQHCKGAVKYLPLQTGGGTQEVRIINEGDVFRLMTRSNLPNALRFEKWLFEEVLPQIRRTGGYAPKGMTLVNEGVFKNMIEDMVEYGKLRAEAAAVREAVVSLREQMPNLEAINRFVMESQPRIKLLTSEKDRLRQMNKLYEEKEELRKQLARKNTPITKAERRQILATSAHWSVADIARYTGRSETAVRRVIKQGGAV